MSELSKTTIHLRNLTLCLQGLKNGKFCRGWAMMAPPLKSSRMKLQRHVRGQTRGSWVCLTQLDHCQMATTCISRVYTCLQAPRVQEHISEYIYQSEVCEGSKYGFFVVLNTTRLLSRVQHVYFTCIHVYARVYISLSAIVFTHIQNTDVSILLSIPRKLYPKTIQ